LNEIDYFPRRWGPGCIRKVTNDRDAKLASDIAEYCESFFNPDAVKGAWRRAAVFIIASFEYPRKFELIAD
jgi:hypothetical protein